jgi:hypothetical protein
MPTMMTTTMMMAVVMLLVAGGGDRDDDDKVGGNAGMTSLEDTQAHLTHRSTAASQVDHATPRTPGHGFSSDHGNGSVDEGAQSASLAQHVPGFAQRSVELFVTNAIAMIELSAKKCCQTSWLRMKQVGKS